MVTNRSEDNNPVPEQNSLPMLFVAIHSGVKYLLDRPATLAALLYAYATYTGFLYSIILYGEFGVEIFNYAQPTDFIFASIKEPVVVEIFKYMLILGISLISGLLVIRHYIVNPFKRLIGLKVYTVLFLVIIMQSYFVYLFYVSLSWPEKLAHERALKLKNGEELMVVYFKDENVKKAITQSSLSLIGTPGDVFIFYSFHTHKTIIIPSSNIGALELQDPIKKEVAN